MKVSLKKSLLSLTFVISSGAWGCYYNVQGLVDYCDSHGYDTLMMDCSQLDLGYGLVSYFTSEPRVTCSGPFAPGLEHFYTCASAHPLSLYKTCPAGETSPIQKSLTPDVSCSMDGSIINPDTLTYTESIDITGVAFRLVYSNDKVEGRKDLYKTRIPLTNPSETIPDSVIKKKLIVNISDQTMTSDHLPTAGAYVDFVWDGKDSLGNTVSGPRQANITVIEEYNPSACELPAIAAGEFVMLSGPIYAGCKYPYPVKSQAILGSIYDSTSLIGGWNFSVRHHYDSLRGVLHLGDGTNFNTSSITQSNGDKWIVSSDRTEVYVFDSNSKHIQTKDALTGIVELVFSYDVSGRPISVEDKYGNETTVQYSGSNPVSITSPFGELTSLTTDTNGYLYVVTSPASESHEMTYSSNGLMLSFEKPSGVSSTMVYNVDGSLLSDVSSTGSEVTLSKTITPEGYNISATSALGRVRSSLISTSGNNYTRSNIFPDQRTHDTRVDLISKESRDDFGVSNISRSFFEDSRFKGESRIPTGVTIYDFGVSRTWSYSETFNLSDPDDPYSFATLFRSWTIEGNTWGSTYTASTKTLVETSPVGRTITTALNSVGDLESKQFASFTPMTLNYDIKGRVEKISQGAARETLFTYNTSNGLLGSVKNALNQITSFTYDLAGRVLTQTLPDSRVISFSYDTNGNLTSVTPPGKPEHTLSYNGFDYLSSYLPPTIESVTNPSTNYVYSHDKELLEINRPDGQSVDFLYHATNGTLSTISLPSGNRTFSYTNALMTQSTSEDFVTRNLDFLGFAPHIDQTVVGDFSSSITYVYNSAARMSEENLIVTPLNLSANFAYDNDGLLTAAGDQVYTRASDTGLLLQTVLGNLNQLFTYSSGFGEPLGIEAIYGNAKIYKETMTRDNLGRISSRTEQYGSDPTKNYAYTYDTAGRLTNVSLNSSPFSQYSYDTNSNRISQTINGITTSGTSKPVKNDPVCAFTRGKVKCQKLKEKEGKSGNILYDDQDRLIRFGSKTFSYNLNGDLSSVSDSSTSTNKTFVYDVVGNLKQVVTPLKTINYAVDAHNRRVVKKNETLAELYYIWNDKNQLVGTADGSGTLISRFIYGSKAHVPDYMINSTADYQIVTNHLGSPVAVVNTATGSVAQKITYDEFGNIVSDTAPGFTPFGFAGCLYDQDTKLCRFGARDYDASVGRWLSKDPILFNGGDTNLYGYVLQDPINYIDPMGKLAWAVAGTVIGGYFMDIFLIEELNKSPDFGRQTKSYMDRRTDMTIPGDRKYNRLKFLKDANEIRPDPIKDPLKNDLRRDLQLYPACG